jgi:uncharacterized protein (DUF433 family)
MGTTTEPEHRYLAPRPGSTYRQYYLKDRRKIRAEILYRMTVGPEPRTPEQVAIDYNVPIDAVREAIEYSIRNESLLREERDRESEWIHALGLDRPPNAPSDHVEGA